MKQAKMAHTPEHELKECFDCYRIAVKEQAYELRYLRRIAVAADKLTKAYQPDAARFIVWNSLREALNGWSRTLFYGVRTTKQGKITGEEK